MSWHFSRLTNNPSVGPNSLIILHAFKTSAIFSNKLCHPCSCWELNWEVLWTIVKQGLGALSKNEKDQEDPLVEHQLGNWWQSSQTKDDCVVKNKNGPNYRCGEIFQNTPAKNISFHCVKCIDKITLCWWNQDYFWILPLNVSKHEWQPLHLPKHTPFFFFFDFFIWEFKVKWAHT